MSLFLNKSSHDGRNISICRVLQRRFALATPGDDAISGNQPIQETRVVCNIVAGVVTLVVACVLAVGWVVSYVCEDQWDAFDMTRHYSIRPIRGMIYFDVIDNGQIPFWAVIPYWSIVVPLAALSAWLLLSKPRAKSTAKTPTCS